MNIFRTTIASLLLAACCACSTPQPAQRTELTIFSINDFHGHLQASEPVPSTHRLADGSKVAVGGYAYLAAKLKERRAAVGANILLAAGDLIGASPMHSNLLKDEPTIMALNQLGLVASAVGNHEFDAGEVELQNKIKGDCQQRACALPDFKGAEFTYLGANVKRLGQAWLPPYIVREVGGVKLGIIGAVTKDVPNLVANHAVADLEFEDEVVAINRVVPELQKLGAQVIVVLIHEGGFDASNDADYSCKNLRGPIVDITQKLDPAIQLIVSGHSHVAYTCKRAGRMLVQGQNAGAYLTEITLTLEQGKVVTSRAVNHLLVQNSLQPEPAAAAFVERVAKLTEPVRKRPVTTLAHTLYRYSQDQRYDSSLGNFIADAQLFCSGQPAEISLINEGGLRTDLVAGAVNFSHVQAVQPFGNVLMRMELNGQEILDILKQQKREHEFSKLYVGQGMSYTLRGKAQQIEDVRVNGVPLDLQRNYRVVVNNFLAEGGDAFSIFKQGRKREKLNGDLAALEQCLKQRGQVMPDMQRVRVIQ